MRCFELVKFARLDSSDRKAIELFREEVKAKSKVLIRDFKDKHCRPQKYGSKIVKAPYMCLGSKVRFGERLCE
ncbi:MAG: hypothetical protein P4M11_02420 [Candidatus Pacebacteria bacterium]|nr:hypothetical protein [Candidatus Paceibacterota bacterium]